MAYRFCVGGGGVGTTFSHMATPSSCTPGFPIKRILPNTDPADTVTIGPFYIPHTVTSLNFAGLSCGVPLLGLGVGGGSELRLATWRHPLSCTLGFSIKRIPPEYCPRGPATHFSFHMVPSLNFAWISRIFPNTHPAGPLPTIPTLLQSPHGPVPEL